MFRGDSRRKPTLGDQAVEKHKVNLDREEEILEAMERHFADQLT